MARPCASQKGSFLRRWLWSESLRIRGQRFSGCLLRSSVSYKVDSTFMANTLLTTGLLCVIAAIIGGGIEALGGKVPVIESLKRQIALGVFGIILLLGAWLSSSSSSQKFVNPSATLQELRAIETLAQERDRWLNNLWLIDEVGRKFNRFEGQSCVIDKESVLPTLRQIRLDGADTLQIQDMLTQLMSQIDAAYEGISLQGGGSCWIVPSSVVQLRSDLRRYIAAHLNKINRRLESEAKR